nr:uncharacterized protein LOC120365303 [Saimiri boliviensis boliviensis]
MVCRQLNMEESVVEIMNQLGADENGKISFQDFTRCRMQLVREIRKEEVDLSTKSDNSCTKKLRDRIASWPTSSDNSLGALSAAKESWEYDSGARDLQSPDVQSQSALQKLLEYGGSSLHQQAALHKLLTQSLHVGNSVGGSYLELANTVAFPVSSPPPGLGSLITIAENWKDACSPCTVFSARPPGSAPAFSPCSPASSAHPVASS